MDYEGGGELVDIDPLWMAKGIEKPEYIYKVHQEMFNETVRYLCNVTMDNLVCSDAPKNKSCITEKEIVEKFCIEEVVRLMNHSVAIGVKLGDKKIVYGDKIEGCNICDDGVYCFRENGGWSDDMGELGCKCDVWMGHECVNFDYKTEVFVEKHNQLERSGEVAKVEIKEVVAVE